MKSNKKTLILSNKIFINSLGQIIFKRRFLLNSVTNFYSFLSKKK
jgi:hypothetical protein